MRSLAEIVGERSSDANWWPEGSTLQCSQTLVHPRVPSSASLITFFSLADGYQFRRTSVIPCSPHQMTLWSHWILVPVSEFPLSLLAVIGHGSEAQTHLSISLTCLKASRGQEWMVQYYIASAQCGAVCHENSIDNNHHFHATCCVCKEF